MALVAGLFFIVFAQGVGSVSGGKSAPLEVHFLDVGQGDSILINYLDHYQILIDGGPSGKKLLYEISKVMPIGDKNIEFVVATHADWDHFGGLIDLVDYYSVTYAMANSPETDKESFQRFLQKLENRKIPLVKAKNGSGLNIGDYLKLDILAPGNNASLDGNNEKSIVSKLDFGKNTFLFTGDIGFSGEKALYQNHSADLDIDWLKVPHHGSKNSTSDFFLKKTSPDFAVISVGAENRYGHPAKELIERLEKTDAEIFRTDRQGTISVSCLGLEKNSCRSK